MIKAVNFAIHQLNHGQIKMTQKCIQNITRKNSLAERFIRTLKNKIYKYMTSISKNVYIDKLDNTVKKYNNIK